jgi:hypothetical protein
MRRPYQVGAEQMQRLSKGIRLAKKKPTLRGLINKLDAIFSKYVRLSHADGRGNIRCFTCDKVAPVAEMDCGHFVGRQHKSTRWLEKNCKPQCRYCNRYCEGKKDVFAVRLVQTYGPHILMELQEQKNILTNYKPPDLEEMIRSYKEKLTALEQ